MEEGEKGGKGVEKRKEEKRKGKEKNPPPKREMGYKKGDKSEEHEGIEIYQAYDLDCSVVLVEVFVL
jgi:hypothetical protein